MASSTPTDLHAATDTTMSIAVSDALTAIDDEVARRRAKVGRFVGGVGAFTTSEMFKDQDLSATKPLARRWDHLLSVESASRKAGSLKATAAYLEKNPGLISLGGALPSSDYFPFERLAIKVPQVSQFSEEETRTSGVTLEVGKHDVSEGRGAYDFEIALNYGQGTGSAQMLRFVTEHTEIVHNPPYRDWQCTLTVGNTSGLEVALRILTSRGDYVLAEEYTYSAAIEAAGPLGIKMVGVRMDGEGLMPEHMDEILTGWTEAEHQGGKKPRLLYTVPTGQNPTGATQGLERRRRVYAVAQKHDVYILEDDPYYFLQMPPSPSSSSSSSSTTTITTEDPSLLLPRSLLPSLLRLDTDGRVCRLDSFSKILAPGSRTGWMTAPAQLIERVVRHHETSVQNPSGWAQVALHALLDVHWRHAGFLRWLAWLRAQYARRRDVFVAACRTHLAPCVEKGVVRWEVPLAGMFLWFEINPYGLLPSHHKQSSSSFSSSSSPPPTRPLNDDDDNNNDNDADDITSALEHHLFEKFIANGVLLVKGSWFLAEKNNHHHRHHHPSHQTTNEETPTSGEAAAGEPSKRRESKKRSRSRKRIFFRATFAAATEAQIDDGVRRVGEVLLHLLRGEEVKVKVEENVRD